MKIVGVEAFTYALQYKHGAYVMSGGRSQSEEPSLVVRLTTDDGHVGWGETCPHGGTYLPAFFEGEVAALGVLAEHVLGLDPRQPAQLQGELRSVLLSGMAAKSAIDQACLDLFGHATGLPVAELLGGRYQSDFEVFVPVPLGTPESVCAFVQASMQEGTKNFQLKVGNDPYEDADTVRAVCEVVDPSCTVIADANGGWNIQQALQATSEMRGLPVYVEQPCLTLSACAEVRRRTDLPLIVDECINSADDLIRARAEGIGGVNLKPGRLGGPTQVAFMRDLAVQLGMMVTIDETWGGAIATATLAHLAASTPSGGLLTVSFFSEWTTPVVADAPPKRPDGRGAAPTGPGLGIVVDESQLGAPLLSVSL